MQTHAQGNMSWHLWPRFTAFFCPTATKTNEMAGRVDFLCHAPAAPVIHRPDPLADAKDQHFAIMHLGDAVAGRGSVFQKKMPDPRCGLWASCVQLVRQDALGNGQQRRWSGQRGQHGPSPAPMRFPDKEIPQQKTTAQFMGMRCQGYCVGCQKIKFRRITRSLRLAGGSIDRAIALPTIVIAFLKAGAGKSAAAIHRSGLAHAGATVTVPDREPAHAAAFSKASLSTRRGVVIRQKNTAR